MTLRFNPDESTIWGFAPDLNNIRYYGQCEVYDNEDMKLPSPYVMLYDLRGRDKDIYDAIEYLTECHPLNDAFRNTIQHYIDNGWAIFDKEARAEMSSPDLVGVVDVFMLPFGTPPECI